jgi:hypothetical protein
LRCVFLLLSFCTALSPLSQQENKLPKFECYEGRCGVGLDGQDWTFDIRGLKRTAIQGDYSAGLQDDELKFNICHDINEDFSDCAAYEDHVKPIATIIPASGRQDCRVTGKTAKFPVSGPWGLNVEGDLNQGFWIKYSGGYTLVALFVF